MARVKTDKPRPARKDVRGINPVKAGVLTLIAALLIGWFGFTKHIPFTHGFRLNAVVADALVIRPNSPVRIAGVTVGRVTGVRPWGQGSGPPRYSEVQMELDREALPVHKDATIKIRPRIFLEGNWFVDLQPGTPSAPVLSSGDSLPVTQAAAPVQFDQILSALQSDTRTDLQELLIAYGQALQHRPTAAQDRGQDPMVKGKTAAEALNMSLDDAAPALRDTATVTRAMTGSRRGDLSRLLRGLDRTATALASDEGTLQGFLTNLDRTLGALAAEQSSLRRTVALLGPTTASAHRAVTALNAALPNIRGLALELVPGMEEAPATIDASYPWIAQMRALVSEDELGGLAAQLAPTTRDLAQLGNQQLRVMPQIDLTSQCFSRYVLPLGDVKVDDGPLSTGVENYKEFWYSLVGLNAESQNFDGNGNYVRFQVGGGKYAWATAPYGPHNPKGGEYALQQWSRSDKPPLGTSPAYTGKLPPYVSSKACKDQKLPNVNGHAPGPPDGSAPGGSPAAELTPEPIPPSAALPVTSMGSPAKNDIVAELAARLNPLPKAKGAGR